MHCTPLTSCNLRWLKVKHYNLIYFFNTVLGLLEKLHTEKPDARLITLNNSINGFYYMQSESEVIEEVKFFEKHLRQTINGYQKLWGLMHVKDTHANMSVSISSLADKTAKQRSIPISFFQATSSTSNYDNTDHSKTVYLV